MEKKKMTQSKVIWRNVFVLAFAGGVAFGLANCAISRTPIAAEYRDALSISYYPMLLEALLGGLMIGFCVSYFLFCFSDKIPTQNPISKSVILTFIVLIIVTILIGGPSSFLATGDVLRYFLIGTIFNFLRFLALGIGIGYLYKRLRNKSSRRTAMSSKGTKKQRVITVDHKTKIDKFTI